MAPAFKMQDLGDMHGFKRCTASLPMSRFEASCFDGDYITEDITQNTWNSWAKPRRIGRSPQRPVVQHRLRRQRRLIRRLTLALRVSGAAQRNARRLSRARMREQGQAPQGVFDAQHLHRRVHAGGVNTEHSSVAASTRCRQ